MIIDELIEKAFCDGYSYAQLEFSEKKEKKKRDKKDKISNALMIGGGTGLVGGSSLAGISDKKQKKVYGEKWKENKKFRDKIDKLESHRKEYENKIYNKYYDELDPIWRKYVKGEISKEEYNKIENKLSENLKRNSQYFKDQIDNIWDSKKTK